MELIGCTKGAEPVRGEYNMSYLGIVQDIVQVELSINWKRSPFEIFCTTQMAGERGIYSLLDMHKDAFNRSISRRP